MAALLPSLHASRDRVMRVFVSSTFVDLGEERDVLVKRVFPEVARGCEARGVGWSDIDLRWGITEEEQARGELLPLCFREVDRCRPFFLAILGERYGSVPRALPSKLVERLPWLRDFVGRSYTELEIRYALNGGTPLHGRFYFRHGPPNAVAAVDPQLQALKDEIEASGAVVRRYASAAELAGLVQRDLEALLDDHFPAAGGDPDERERAAHLAWLRKRTRHFAAPPGALERLDRFLAGKGPPLLVQGAPGSGKTSLLANWLLRLSSGPERSRTLLSRLLPQTGSGPGSAAEVLIHCVGAGSTGREWPSVARRLVREGMRAAGLDGAVPDDPETLAAELVNVLQRLGARGRTLVILVGADRVMDPAWASPLSWLPDTLPDGVRLVVTVAPGAAGDALLSRGWEALDVPPLSTEARRALTGEYLTGYGKRLETPVLERVARASQGALPLYLSVLLGELRIFGSHEGLSEYADRCLSCDTPEELLDAVLARMEEDLGASAGVVRSALALLASARVGLAEAELLALLGSAEAPLAAAHWGPLHAALDEFLVEAGGRLTLFHETLVRVVRRRYLPDEARRVETHRQLAGFFRARGGARAAEELPGQLAEAGEWEELFGALADPELLALAWAADRHAVIRAWSLLRDRLGRTPPDAYRELAAAPDPHPGAVLAAAQLLRATGYAAEALPLLEAVVRRQRRGADEGALQCTLSQLAVVLRQLGRLDEAHAFLADEEALCRRSGDAAALQANLGNQGVVLRELGRFTEALERHREEESICERLGAGSAAAASRLNRAAVHLKMGELRSCATLLGPAERAFARLGDALGLQAALEVRGRLLARRGRRNDALACYQRRERLCAQVLYAPGVRDSLLSQAELQQELLDFDRAAALLARHERLSREAEDTASLSRGLTLRATLFLNVGLPGRAETILREAQEQAIATGDAELVRETERIARTVAEALLRRPRRGAAEDNAGFIPRVQQTADNGDRSTPGASSRQHH